MRHCTSLVHMFTCHVVRSRYYFIGLTFLSHLLKYYCYYSYYKQQHWVTKEPLKGINRAVIIRMQSHLGLMVWDFKIFFNKVFCSPTRYPRARRWTGTVAAVAHYVIVIVLFAIIGNTYE